MLKKMLRHKSKIAIVLVLVSLLVCIRAFENVLFYDPFLAYFKIDNTNLPFPEFDSFKLFLGLTFRYFLNTILSLGIIYVVFKDMELIKFASVLYVLLFVILILLFFGMLYLSNHENHFLLFYIRRFLIQPLFVILFLPAFFFQKQIR
jgi:exosortase F-associated protein